MKPLMLLRLLPRLCLLASTGLLGACASLSPDSGFSQLQASLHEHLQQDVAWARDNDQRQALKARVDALLAQPLSADDAVQVALLNNRGLQAAFGELALADADRVQADRLPNPRLSMLRASQTSSGEVKLEQVLGFDLLALITRPQVSDIERRRFEQVRRQTGLTVLTLASDTRQAYYAAVAAEQSAGYAEQVMQAAQAGADLGRLLTEAGNWSRLSQAQEEGFLNESALALTRARETAASARERVLRLLGLSGPPQTLALPARLPDLPDTLPARPDVEQTAMARRLDLQATRLQVEALAARLGLSRTTRFVNVLEFGPARELEGPPGSGAKTGFQVSFELPLFDWGDARVAKAEAIYMQAVERAAQRAVEARSEVRESDQVRRSRYEIARRYRDEVLPLKRRIGEEKLLRYNGMLLSPFELLADARTQAASVRDSIEALRDFWIAQARLDMSLLGPAGPAPAPGTDAAAPDPVP